MVLQVYRRCLGAYHYRNTEEPGNTIDALRWEFMPEWAEFSIAQVSLGTNSLWHYTIKFTKWQQKFQKKKKIEGYKAVKTAVFIFKTFRL